MQTASSMSSSSDQYRDLDAAALLALLEEKDQKLKQKDHQISEGKQKLLEHANYIRILEEYMQLAKLQKFAASSEKLPFQVDFFDEAELELSLSEFEEQRQEPDKPPAKIQQTTRNRGFSEKLERVRVELRLSDEERAGAIRTFFTKVKEELEFIPAKMQVRELWQEKAVFEEETGGDRIVTAPVPAHPLGKAKVGMSLLAWIIVSKYADGLPLYRQENILKRYDADVSRTSMAQWIIRLAALFQPMMERLRTIQNQSDYLQADETRLQVLKEKNKPAQSDKWMWVIRGGPPDKPSVLFDYDPSRGGAVATRLLEGFRGTLQADGYSGYAQVCRTNQITRIGCMDHARRKFVEAVKAAKPKKSTRRVHVGKAEVAIGKIRKLYAIEEKIKDWEPHAKREARQELAKPVLADIHEWLNNNLTKVPTGGKTHIAIQYMLNQWDYLVGYCEDGNLNISNALAENAIRPFATGRKAWLFADTPHGARASAMCYSLIETAKANGLEPHSYILYLLQNIAGAETTEEREQLLPWNIPDGAVKKLSTKSRKGQ